jgi:uncharacterized protein
MANRLYIYASEKLDANSSTDMIVEANYELPLFFYPLFHSNAKLVKSDIFASAAEGIAYFERLYDFINLHADTLIENKKNWTKARKKISAELEKHAKQKHLMLEMSDVFQMSDQPSKLQAEAMLTKIQLGLDVIQNALDANNPLILDQLVDFRETGLTNFKAYLNYESYEYGWAYFDAQYEVDNGTNFPEIIQENGKYGIKNTKGKILTPIEYDNIYNFAEYTKLCVAEKNKKFVFLNAKGEKEFDAEFDDLFDYFDNYEPKKQIAIAKLGEQYGLINRKGQWVVESVWDDLSGLYDRGVLIAAKKGDVWGVIDEAGKVIVEPSLPYAPMPDDEYETSCYTCSPENGEPVLYLSLKWQPFTLKKHEKSVRFHASDEIKITFSEGKSARYGLINQDAETLLETIYNEIEYEYEPAAYRVKLDKKWGLFHPTSGWLLHCEFDSLNSVYSTLGSKTDELTSPLWITRKGKQYGVFNSKKKAFPWVLDCAHGKITAFAKNVLGVAHNSPPAEAGVWVHNASTGLALAGPYASLTDCQGTLSFAAVLGFSQTEVFTIGQTGIVKPLTAAQADSLMMQIPTADKYTGEYYMTKAQGKLIEQYFSTGLKTAELLETAYEFDKKGQYKQSLAIYLQTIAQTDASTKDKTALSALSTSYVNAGWIYACQPEFKNVVLARDFYQKAADLGDSQGMNNLACSYRYAQDGTKDMAKAIALLEQAYNLKNMQAANNLGDIYYSGDLRDQAKALKYYLACYREYPENLAIAWLYDSFLNDYTSALVYYQKSAKEGIGYSFNRIGEMWQEGLLGKADVKKAQEFYVKAMQAEESSGDAGLNVAKLLIETDKAAAKVAFDFALAHEDVVDGLTEFGEAQGWL